MRVENKLQALVYDILPLATAVFSYAIGSRKLSANEQFFVGVLEILYSFKGKMWVPHIKNKDSVDNYLKQ